MCTYYKFEIFHKIEFHEIDILLCNFFGPNKCKTWLAAFKEKALKIFIGKQDFLVLAQSFNTEV